MTRTSETTASDLEPLVHRRLRQATENFEEAKAKFAEDFATNPKYAIEWHADKVARAQVHFEWWTKLAEVLQRRGPEETLAYAAERLQIEIEAFFGSNSTCPWTNALRRIEAEVYSSLARRELSDLRAAANSNS